MTPETFLAWLAGDEDLSGPRTAVIVAHPDDEVVGAGSRLVRLRDALFVHVTDGAPRDGRDAAAHGFRTPAAYAGARRDEAVRALGEVDVAPDRILGFGLRDQEACLHLVSLTGRIAGLIRQRELEVVLTQPYEGGHPDHDAIAFAVHAARRSGPSFAIAEMTAYHRGVDGLESGVFLSGETGVALPVDRALRRRLLEHHRTQQAVLAPFVDADHERFRGAPNYDFARPPHDGPLYYESFDWGMTGDRFRALASEALVAMGLAWA